MLFISEGAKVLEAVELLMLLKMSLPSLQRSQMVNLAWKLESRGSNAEIDWIIIEMFTATVFPGARNLL